MVGRVWGLGQDQEDCQDTGEPLVEWSIADITDGPVRPTQHHLRDEDPLLGPLLYPPPLPLLHCSDV